MATKAAKKKTTAVNLDAVIAQGKTLNQEVIKLSDHFVSSSIKNGEKYQILMEKAIESGVKLFEKQQDIMFDTLETLKGQYSTGTVRFKKLIGWAPKAKKAKAAKAVKKAVKAVKKTSTTKITTPKNTPKAKVRTAKKAVSATKDNLKAIKGIGPKTEKLFNAAGIFSYKQLGSAKKQTVVDILEASGSVFKAEYPMAWIREAKKFAKK